MKWIKFEGQKLETGDILWLDSGLGFVDSGYTDKTPSRINSIPENWSFSFENGDIDLRRRELKDSAFISNKGYYYAEYSKKPSGQILFVLKPTDPTKNK